MNDCNYDTGCTLTSLLVLDLENFKLLMLIAHMNDDDALGS
jgi:hypothetical protein